MQRLRVARRGGTSGATPTPSTDLPTAPKARSTSTFTTISAQEYAVTGRAKANPGGPRRQRSHPPRLSIRLTHIIRLQFAEGLCRRKPASICTLLEMRTQRGSFEMHESRRIRLEKVAWVASVFARLASTSFFLFGAYVCSLACRW